MTMKTDPIPENAPPGSFMTQSRIKAWFFSTLRGHSVITKFKTPYLGPFGILLYRSRYVLAPRNGVNNRKAA